MGSVQHGTGTDLAGQLCDTVHFAGTDWKVNLQAIGDYSVFPISSQECHMATAT